MKKLLFIMTVFSFAQVFSQKEDLAVFGGVNIQKQAAGNFTGGELSARYYVANKLSLGVQSTYASKKFDDGFIYLTDRTILNNFTFSGLVQYDVIANDKFIFGAFLGNGIRLKTLRNLNDPRTYEYYDEFGFPYYIDLPKKLNRDLFYVLTPGLDLSFRVGEVGKTEKVGLYITSKGGYQFNFGEDQLTNKNNSRNLVWSIGVTFKATTKEN